MPRLLLLLLLLSATLASAQTPRPNFVAVVQINTLDQPCGVGVVRTFSKRWISPYATTVYAHRVESFRSIGGTLTPQAEGFSHAYLEQTGEQITMMPGQMKWPETTHVFVNTFPNTGPLPIHPGQSVLVVGTCVAYGPQASSTIMKWVVDLLLYDAP